MQAQERKRLEMLESRLIKVEDFNMAIGSQLDFIQADVRSTYSAMHELVAMIK